VKELFRIESSLASVKTLFWRARRRLRPEAPSVPKPERDQVAGSGTALIVNWAELPQAQLPELGPFDDDAVSL
jgi:hypothetical protein